MNHYHWSEKLEALYRKAVKACESGARNAEDIFTRQETLELSSIGLQPINVFDYAEDFVKYGEPGWNEFLLVAAARRDYYLYELHCAQPSPPIAESDLPAKTDAIGGIEWLPRITRKAKCFLEGTLPHDIMYGCGGDRRFLKQHDLHLADFLRMTWAVRGDAEKILKFVRK
ncbi:MAG: hypothetical protein N2322_04405 [Terrimicrobiaceae bacterium]|nr:hypothetical protein [Terrimicrobiaceae bacterium]